ncbi:hypothetical protein TNCV_1626231 [Trichonephila clavipes]|nr:hypothetical protein TNCV_1626231 [Trichonephila clavipes]
MERVRQSFVRSSRMSTRVVTSKLGMPQKTVQKNLRNNEISSRLFAIGTTNNSICAALRAIDRVLAHQHLISLYPGNREVTSAVFTLISGFKLQILARKTLEKSRNEETPSMVSKLACTLSHLQ